MASNTLGTARVMLKPVLIGPTVALHHHGFLSKVQQHER